MSDNISSDVIDEIFTRLPAKSLLRFRSVSKSLRARISSPDFIRKHALLSPPKYLILHRDCYNDKVYYTVHSEDQLPLRNSGGYDDETTFKFPFKYAFDRDAIKILGSCNGILCVHVKAAYSDYFFLWNPFIRRTLRLPEVPFWDPVGFDHNVSVGFGFDSLNDDYKIVWISISEFRLPPLSSFVYVRKTDSWSEITSSITTPITELSAQAVFVNGAFYWMAFCGSDGVDDPDRRYILTFDLSTHMFGKIVLPKPKWGINGLAVIKGSLALFSMTYNGDNSGVWVMEEHDNNTSSWSVFIESHNYRRVREKFFELTTSGDFLLQNYYTTPEVYNFKTGVSKALQMRIKDSPNVDIQKYVESLELLDKGKAYEEKQPYFVQSKKKIKKKTVQTWFDDY